MPILKVLALGLAERLREGGRLSVHPILSARGSLSCRSWCSRTISTQVLTAVTVASDSTLRTTATIRVAALGAGPPQPPIPAPS